MDGSILYTVVFGALLLAAYLGGGMAAWLMNHEARRDRAELRDERQTLIAENRQLTAEILKLKEEIIDLRSKLAAAIQEIHQLSAAMSREAQDFTG